MSDRPEWFAVPYEIFSRSDLSLQERVVLVYLCSRANRNKGECWPSYATIAASCGISQRATISAVRGLVDKGVIGVSKRRDDHGRQTSNLYRLRFGESQGATGAPPYAQDAQACAGDAGTPMHEVHPPYAHGAPELQSLNYSQRKDRQTDTYTQRGSVSEADPEPRPSVGPTLEDPDEPKPPPPEQCASLQDVIAVYHAHIGMIGPTQYTKLQAWHEDNGMAWGVIAGAVDLALEADIPPSRRFAYAEGVLRNLHNDGVHDWRAFVEHRQRNGPVDLDAMFTDEELAAMDGGEPP